MGSLWYTLQGGFTGDYTEPRLFIFGLHDNQNLSPIYEDASTNSIAKPIFYNNPSKENHLK